MYAKHVILTVFSFILFTAAAQGQACTVLGQNPGTAFPVCGTSDFKQDNVPICGSHPITVPGCPGDSYFDYNPFWYQFTCFETGTLGFTITPVDLSDDYDWQLYDITGHDPEDVFTNASLVVTGNWAGTSGTTGARAGGSSTIQCGSDPTENKPTFSSMPNIIKGHIYLLLVSHFTQTQSGYSLSFSGGTASITDPSLPGVTGAAPNCDGTQAMVKLSKKMKCSSLSADGSDFNTNIPGITVTAAEAAGCELGFDMDSVLLTFSTPLPEGNHFITCQNGGDGNTLLDNCNNAIGDTTAIPISVLPKQPTYLDSLVPVGCAPNVLQLVFQKPIRCSSLSADGSDFAITGTYPVQISSANGDCNNGLSTSVFLHLSQPLTQEGSFTIQIKNGIDGNTIIDACGEETPALQTLPFDVKDTVSAAFTALVGLGCKTDTISLSHNGGSGIDSWHWLINNRIKRSGQTNEVIFDSFGEKEIQLIVSNGVCSDTAYQIVNLDNELKAGFLMPDLACPNDPVTFRDTSIGNIVAWQWNFGNGNSSFEQVPPQQIYPQSNRGRIYTVQLVVQNDLLCKDTVSLPLNLVYSCQIAVPTGFTPNGNGVNDYLYPLNAYKADNLVFTVYNRLGQVVFQSKDRSHKWNGRLNGQLQGAGTYIWTLQYVHHDTRQAYFLKGTTVLLR